MIDERTAGALESTARLENIRDLVFPLIKGKRLLDIGSIGHDYEWRKKIGTFYFAEFHTIAAVVRGIDILEDHVERARKDGYQVVVGDAETFLEENHYDVIFAGELIEHLSNPGHFLRCAYRNLTATGVLVLTTPNAFSLSRLAKCFAALTNEPPVNPEHTCYFTPRTLRQLVTRENFVVQQLYYVDYDYGQWPWPFWKTAFLKINSFLSAALPKLSQSFVVVLAKSAPSLN